MLFAVPAREITNTYSLGFFFGPGFPLGLGVVSLIWFTPRLAPGLGPGTPLRRGVSAAEVPAAGVDAASDALSDGGIGASTEDDAGEEGSFSLTGESALDSSSLMILFFLSFTSGGGGLAKRLNKSGESLRTTTPFEEGPDRLERPLVAVAAGISAQWVICR